MGSDRGRVGRRGGMRRMLTGVHFCKESRPVRDFRSDMQAGSLKELPPMRVVLGTNHAEDENLSGRSYHKQATDPERQEVELAGGCGDNESEVK